MNEPKIRYLYDWCINPIEALFKWQILYVGPITPYGYFQHNEKQPGFYDSVLNSLLYVLRDYDLATMHSNKVKEYSEKNGKAAVLT